MKKIIFRSQEDEDLYNLIESAPDHWYEENLPDHPLRPQFNRKLVVTAFNAPYGELFVCVFQYLIFKDSGEIYKKLQMPMWEIKPTNKENIITENGLMMADEYDTDENGDIIPETQTEIEVKVNSVKYVRALSLYKLMYIPDIFTAFMTQYKEYFATEIDDI